MPSRAWVVTTHQIYTLDVRTFQCPLGLELLRSRAGTSVASAGCFNALSGLSCYAVKIVTFFNYGGFNALSGLSCYKETWRNGKCRGVSMPSRAWVVTARMSNILNFSWCFLCIPAIYRCILAYLPIFFNQLSKFLRCESPSTFLGTCLSHHSFIIFLVTNTNTLLSGLYLISTKKTLHFQSHLSLCVNALSGLYLISTDNRGAVILRTEAECQCPLGLIPHFYNKENLHWRLCWDGVSMPSRAYTSFLRW